MTDATTTKGSAPAAPAPKPSFTERYGAAMPYLLAAAVLLAIVGSLCLGAYPVSFGHAAQIILHLASPFPLPDNPSWSVKEITAVQVIRCRACCSPFWRGSDSACPARRCKA